jgi:hydroxypyruvate isomerase
MRFAANLGFLYQGLALPDQIRAAAKDGFDAVECHWPYTTHVAEVRAALRDTGLPMLALNTAPGVLTAGEFGLAALPGRTPEAHAAIVQAIDYAAAIGAHAVHVMAGRTTAPEAGATYRDNLAVACDLAAQHGLMVLIEPISHTAQPDYHLSTIEQAARTIAAVGHDNLKILFDVYHIQTQQGDLIHRARTYLPLIGHVQIASVPERCEPDGGDVNIPAFLDALGKSGWHGDVGAEYHPRLGDTTAGLGWLAAMRATIHEKGRTNG